MHQSSLAFGVAPSQVEKRSLARALQDDIKSVDDRLFNSLAPGQQCRTLFIRDKLQNRILGICWLIFKVQTSYEVIEQSASKHGNTDMRSLYSLTIEWYWTWFDRLKPVAAIFCCTGTAKSQKDRIQLRCSLIRTIVILAIRVRLPDLDHCIRHRQPITIEYVTLDANMLTGNPGLGQHMTDSVLAQQRGREEWSNCLRTC